MTPGKTQGYQLRVGCAMWAHKDWPGRHLPNTGSDLAAYATWCTTVEGNTTFYAVPPPATVQRWLDESPPSFRFCFKLPRTITHDRRLRDASSELSQFLRAMTPLASRLGPIQVQLPPSFEPNDLPVLESFLDQCSREFSWAVEVRHRDFFAGGSHEQALDEALAATNVNRVILDSRSLFDASPRTPAEIEGWERKPRVPVRPVATGNAPIVRLIGQSNLGANLDRWRQWLPKLSQWVRDGLEPHVFTHTPDNVDALPLARRFHQGAAEHMRSAGERLDPLPEPVAADTQLGLWD